MFGEEQFQDAERAAGKADVSPPMFLTAGLDTIMFGGDFTSIPSVHVLPLTGPACSTVAGCEGGESGPDYGLHPNKHR
jgi:hypothetical protein